MKAYGVWGNLQVRLGWDVLLDDGVVAVGRIGKVRARVVRVGVGVRVQVVDQGAEEPGPGVAEAEVGHQEVEAGGVADGHVVVLHRVA